MWCVGVMRVMRMVWVVRVVAMRRMGVVRMMWVVRVVAMRRMGVMGVMWVVRVVRVVAVRRVGMRMVAVTADAALAARRRLSNTIAGAALELPPRRAYRQSQRRCWWRDRRRYGGRRGQWKR